ncbi:hypothetical protein, partial [Paracoccus versutus]|uniref:hypothetical protein n=1 Tax=Paracoccus versutus TaxID=34007 RepID=UPI001C68E507
PSPPIWVFFMVLLPEPGDASRRTAGAAASRARAWKPRAPIAGGAIVFLQRGNLSGDAGGHRIQGL